VKKYIILLFASFLAIQFQLIAQPVISFQPTSFNETINDCDDSVSTTLTIYNTGNLDLDYEILEVTPLNFAYITNSTDNSVSVLDLSSNTVVGAPIPVGSNPWRATLDPSGEFVYVSCRGADSISVIRTSDNTVVDTIPVGSNPSGLAFTPDGNFAYVGNMDDDNVMVIDCNTNTVINTITGISGPKDIVITPDGKYAYVGTEGTGIVVIEIGPDVVIVNISGAPSWVQSLAVTPDGRYVYASEGDGGSVVVAIDVSTNAVIATIGGFDSPHELDVTPDGRFVYVADMGDNEIEVIEVSTNTIVATVFEPALNSIAWGLAISRNGKYAYVAVSDGPPSLFILDIGTNSFISSASLPGNNAKGISTLEKGVPWLAEIPIVGTITPVEDSVVIDVTFYASGLSNGTYTTNLYVRSNDSTSLIDTIPVTLTVNGSPELALSDSCLDLDTVGVGGTNAASYSISNDGCDTLIVSSITTAGAEYTNDSVSLVIPPFQSRQVTVTFAPTAPGLYLDTIVIASTDIDTMICLTGFAEPAPAALFSPNPITASTTTCNDTIDVLLTISNTGGDTLNFAAWGQTNTPTFEFAYIANFGNAAVEVLDLTTNALVASIPVGSNPSRISFHPGGQLVYCSNGQFGGSSNISVIQVSDNTVIATISVGSAPHGMGFTPDGTFGYVANRNSDNVSKINCITQTEVDIIDLTGGDQPMDIVVTPDGQKAYVATKFGGIRIIDIATDAVVGSIGGVSGCHSMIITPDGQFLYVSEGNGSGTRVVKIEIASNSIVNTISGLSNPHGLAITQDGSTIYVANKNNEDIVVIDVATNSVISTISDLAFTSGYGVWGIALSPDDEYVYVNMPWGGAPNYAVIETATENVVATFDVPGNAGFEITTLRSGLPWLTVAPDSGTVPPGGDTTITVQVNGFGLPSGTYTGNVVFSSNDPNSPQYVPVTFTIDGVPFMDLDDNCLDLDTAIEFTTNIDSFLIYNRGCDTLFISDANNALAEFTLSDTSDFVEAYDSAYVRVAFAPLDSGLYLDTITLVSNDGDTTICLRGYALQSPTIAFTPASFNITIPSCCDSVADSIMIINNGAADLIYTPSLAGYDSTQTVIYTVDGALTDFTFDNIPFTDSMVVTITLNGDFDGGGEMAELYIDGDYLGVIPDGNLTNGTDIVVPYTFTGAQLAAWLADGTMIVTLDNDGSVGTFVGTEIHQVQIFISAPSWVNYSSVTDTLAPGDTTFLNVVFTSCGSNTGTYTSSIFLTSNDPQSSIDTVALAFTVTGAPDIDLSPTGCLDLDTAMEFSTNVDSFLIYNRGCDTLFITDANNVLAEFTLSDTAGFILPYDSTYVSVTFAPLDSGLYLDTITIFNNDVVTTICLRGYALKSPTISYTPASFNITIASCCDSVADTVEIVNTGAADLIYSQEIIGGAGGGGLITYSESFTQGAGYAAGSPQYDNWISFRAQLDTIQYSFGSVNIRGSQDPVGVTCSDPATVNLIAEALRAGNSGVTYSCGGILWRIGGCGTGTELNANNTGTDCNCPSGYTVRPTINPGNQNWGGLNGTACGAVSQTLIVEFEYTNFVSSSPPGPDTLAPGDTTEIYLLFNSCGLDADTYTGNLIINSNDPLSSIDTVPLTFTLAGAPDIDISPTGCLDLDTAMEFTTNVDSFLIYNRGCDTLFITDANNSLAEFTLSDTADTIAPGDSVYVFVTFAPLDSGLYLDTITIFNNDVVTTICLTAYALKSPTIAFTPASFNITIPSCCDSVADTLQIVNTGAADLIFTIEGPGLDTVELLVLTHGVDMGGSGEFNNTIAAISTYFTKYNLTTTATTSAATLTAELTGKDVVLIPERENGGSSAVNATYTTFGTPLQNFVNNGGRVIFCGSQSAYAPSMFNTGLFTGSYAGNTTAAVQVIDSSFCVTDSVNATFNGSNATFYCNITNSDAFRLVEYLGNDVVTLREIGSSGGQAIFIAADFFSYNLDVARIVANAVECSIGLPGLSTTPTTDTVFPGDTTEIYLMFNSCGLDADTYTGNLIINSNDPLNPMDTVPVIFEIQGTANIDLDVSCLDFDTVIELTTSIDSFYIKNIGCDTLFITDINNLSDYSVSDTTDTLLPADSSLVYVTFSPSAPGLYQDSLTIINNDTIIKICLTGFAIPRPTISFSQDSIDISVVGCCDSATVDVTVYNTGGSDLNWTFSVGDNLVDNFDPSFDPTIWSSLTGIASTTCGSLSGNALYFTNNTSRQATTIDLNTSAGGNVQFYLKIADISTGGCENADPGEEVVLEYSNNGGGTWFNITTFSTVGFNNFTFINEVIPPAAQTASTRFRFRQPSFSGSCCDHWAIDNLTITTSGNCTPWACFNPDVGTTIAGDSSIVTFDFSTCGQSSGVYMADVIVFSNDPLASVDTFPISLIVVGLPNMNRSDTCLYLDSIMEFATHLDSVWIRNDGCDTLFVTDANTTLPEYTLSDTTFTVLPGDSALMTVLFSPTTSGAFVDTINLINNDADTIVCLTGFGFPRPIMTVDTDSIDVLIVGCCDSVTVPITIYNTGGNDLIWTIDTSDYVSRYDGVNDYVAVPTDYPGLSVVTVEAWIYPTNTVGNHWIAGNARDCCGNAGGFNLYMVGTDLQGSIWRTVSATTVVGGATGVLSLNTWQHVAMVYTGTQVDLYLDGALVGSSAPQGASAILNAPQNFVIGVLAYTAPNFFDYQGDIDEVRVWNTARTPGEIAGNRNTKLLGTESGLIGYWNFDGQNADDLTGNGNNGTFINQATTVIGSPFGTPVFNASLDTDTVPAGDSSVVDIVFTTCGKSVGTYNSLINIVSNDPLNSPYTIPATFEVQGYPLIVTSDTCLDFDTILQFTSTSLPLTVYNTGCDTLVVTNILSTSADITVDTTSFTLLPGDSLVVTATFSPLSVGAYAETLTIFNNDTDTTVCLIGFALSPPIIAYSPDTFFLTSTVCNDTILDTLTIYNSGVSDLIYSLLSIGSADGYSALFDAGSEYIQIPTMALPASYTLEAWAQFPLAVTGQWRTLYQTGGSQHHVLVQNTGLLGVWNGGFFSSGFDVDGLTPGWHFITAVGTGSQTEFFVDGVSVGTSTTKLTSGINYFGNYVGGGQYWGNADEFRIWNYARTTTQTQNSMNSRLQGNESGLLGYWNFDDQTANDITGGGSNGTLTNGATLIPQNAPVGFTQFNITGDTVVFGDSSLVGFEVSTFGLITGTYYDTIIISSNDPLSPSDTVPVIIDVIGYPVVATSDTCLNFDSILQFTSTNRSIMFYNTGCDTLFVDSIVATMAVYTVDTGNFMIVPGDSLLVTATFAPVVLGAHDDTLTVYNNDTIIEICLIGVSVPPPIISAAPNPLDVTITACTDSVTVPLNVYNTGGSTLYWNVDTVGSFMYDLDLISDTVFIGDSSVINVFFDATNLNPGMYSDTVYINSNDPITPVLQVPTILTISPFPISPSANDTAICFGNASPGIYASGDTALGDTIRWYSDPALLTMINEGDTLTPTDTALGMYTYYITLISDSCEGPADSVTLTINAGSDTTVALDTGSCFGDPVPDLTSSGTNLTLWYDDAGLTNLVNIGSPYASGVTAVGVYTYYVRDSIGGCLPGPVDTSTLTITGLPPAPITSDTTICEGDSVPNLVAIGANIEWYDDAGLTIPLGSNDSLDPGVSAGGVYDFYVTQDSVGCPSLPDTVLLTINQTTPPTTSDAAICFNDATAPLVAVGDSINWYSDSALTVFIFQGDSFFTPNVAVGSYTYWATETDSITGCESIGDSAVYTINPIPAAPLTSDTSECFGSPMPDLAAVGAAILWYQNPALDTVVNSGTPFATGDTAVGPHKYYVTQTVLGCESPADSATLTILPIPVAPTTVDSTICFGMATPDFIAIGANIHWYSDAGLTAEVFVGDTFASGDTAVGAHTYYAADSVAGCYGPGSMMTVTIIAPPATPVVNDETICDGTPTPDLIYVGSNTQWYDDAPLTNIVSNLDTFVTGDSNPGIYTYYVTDSTSVCPRSPSDTVVLTINAIPPIPVASDTTICDGDSIPDLVAVGIGIQWYSDTGLTTLIFSGDSLVAPDTIPGVFNYYVTQTIAACEGPADTVTLSINSTPAPTGSNIGVCFGDPVPDFTAVGTNLTWYSDSLLNNLVFAGNPFASGDTAIGDYIYYVRDSINGCPGPAIALTLSINLGLTAPPVANDANSCYGSPNAELTAVGTFLTWYTDSTLSTIIFSGDSFSSADTGVGSYVYYVTDSVAGCPEGLPDTATLTILALPASPVASDSSACFGTTGVMVAAGVGVIQWYSDTALNNMVSMGDTLVPADTAIGSYTYYATDSVGICESNPDSAVFTILSIPPTPSSTDQTVCVGTPAPDFISSGANIQWYGDSALTTLLMAGDTLVPGDTLVGVYTYYLIDSSAGCNSLIVPVQYTIDGASQIAISDVCFDFDSVIETTTSTDTLEFYNAGCDTLIITGITNATGEYSVDTTGLAILPGDTGIIIISFTPPDSGTYVDTLLITSNASDTSVCLTGVGLGAPEISISPDSFNLSFTGCCDSSIMPMTIYNTGESNLIYTMGADSAWITFSLNDTIEPGDSNIVNITFNSCIINPGNYIANIYINSNDPTSPLDTAFAVLTKDTLPDPPVSADIAVCFGDPIPDFTATSPDDSIVWYNDAALTIRLFEGDTFTAPDIVIGIYTYYLTAWRDSCEGNADSVQLDISAPPTNPAVADMNQCFGYPNPALIHDGTIVQWFDDTLMTNIVFVGDSFVSTDTVVGTYTYFLNDSTPGCPVGLPDTVVLTIDPSPVAPGGNDTTICFGNQTPDLIATGVNLKWYDDSALLSQVFAGDTFPTGNTAVGVYRYWVTQTDTLINSCVSFPNEIVLTINGIPAAPNVADSAICVGTAIPDFVASGSNVIWYDILTNVIATGDTLTPPDTIAGVFTYYVTDSVAACATGPADTVYFTINAFSPTPTVLDTSICFGSAGSILVGVGANLQWYDDSLLANLVFSGDSFAAPDTAVGTHTYYVTDSLTGCAQSSPDTSDFIIEVVPSAPITADTAICFGDPTPDLSATGVEVFWYSDSLLDTLVFAGNPFNNNDSTIGVYNYYVTQVDSNVNACEGPASTATLTINAMPAAPTTSNVSVCEGVTNPDLIAVGTDIQWYSDSTLLNPVGSGDTLVVTDSAAGSYDYYATQTILGCEGPGAIAVLVIDPTPAAPIAVNDSACVVSATGIPSLFAAGTNITWYSDSLLTNAVATGNFFSTGDTAPGTWTYYVTDSLPGCPGPATQVSLVISPIAGAPVGVDMTACTGQTIPNLTATGTGTDLRWFSDPTLLIQVGSGSAFATGETSAGVYTYYVTEFAPGCSAGPATPVTLTINPTPLVTLSGYTFIIQPGDSVTIEAFNATTYAWSPSTGLNTTSGPKVNAGPSVTTKYTVTGTNSFGCSADTSCWVIVDDGTSIDDLEFVQNVQLFPNPSRGIFELIFTSNLNDPIEVSVFNAVGEVIVREDVALVGGSYHKTFNLIEMATGVYYVRITSAKGMVNKKMVILQDY